MNYKEFIVKDNMFHQPPMLLVDEVLGIDETKGTTFFNVKQDCIFLDEKGVLSRTVFVEIAAQSFAAIDIFRKKQKSIPNTKGFLATVRDFTFFYDAKVGDKIICNLERFDVIGPLHLIRAELLDEKDKIFAQGEIRIYELPE